MILPQVSNPDEVEDAEVQAGEDEGEEAGAGPGSGEKLQGTSRGSSEESESSALGF